jgi:phytanoyl-CoA hydroxylase
MTEADTRTMVNVEMEAGDTIFFHPLLIHGSGRNNSDRYRKAISCHYASCDCQYIEVTGTMQEDIAKEVEHMAKTKAGGMEISFMDVWRFKSRLVAGKEGANF